MRALAGALALIERSDDRAVKRHRAGVVAHAGHRARRGGVLIGAHQIHQAGACPIGIAVEARLVGLRAFFAIAGERSVDQPLIERHQFLVSDSESLAHRRWKIGNEHIGLADQPIQHAPAFRFGEVERKALLVTRLQHPREVMRTRGISRQIRQVAIGIAEARGFDFDHVGAEIRQHGCGGWRCDETRAVENLEAFEDALFHGAVAPLVSACLFHVMETVVEAGFECI